METLEKIQTRHKETLRTFDSILSVLAPVTFNNKCYFVDDKNIERLAKSTDFLSTDFCGVRVVSERTGTPGTGTDKIIHTIKIEGENFGYEVSPDALPTLRKNIEKSFKAVESNTKKENKTTHQAPTPRPVNRTESPKIEASKTTPATEIKKIVNKIAPDSKNVYICALSKGIKPVKNHEEIKPNQTNDELKTVNFQIEGRYIDQIKNGTKVEDYRAINPVNAHKLCEHIDKKDLKEGEQFVTHNKEIWRLKKDLTQVRFFNGYKSDRKELLIELKGIELNKFVKNIPEGMKPGTICFTLILGQIVVSKNFAS